MAVILLISIFMVGLGYVFSNSCDNLRFKAGDVPFWPIALVCFSIKIILGALYFGHTTDMDCFSAWSDMIFESGFSAFYTSDAFTDYPPGYMYILYILGALRKLPLFSGFVLLKVPAILSDIVLGFFIYKTGQKNFSPRFCMVLSLIYMLNPAVLLNSSLWGQVDGIYTMLITGVVLLLINKKPILSFFLFAICIFVKPQALIYTPVILFSVAEEVFLPNFDGKKLARYVFFSVLSIGLMALLALPFGIENVVEQYISTMKSYPHLTVNAFNFWGALGQNWTDITSYFSVLGYLFIIVITVFSGVIYFRTKGESKYFLAAGFLGFSTYMLSVKMHDRYAYPAIAMFIMAYLYSKKKEDLFSFILISASQFINTAWVLFIYEQDPSYHMDSPTIVVFSILNILLLGYLSLRYVKIPKLRLKETSIVGCIMIIYSVIAFVNLGDFEAPSSYAVMEKGTGVTIEFEPDVVSEILIYPGANEIEETLEVIGYNANVKILETKLSGDVFKWNSIAVDAEINEIAFFAEENLDIIEVAVKNIDGDIIPIRSGLLELSDEQDMVPHSVSYRNGTYFDEIYHARTAYEFLEGKPVYEWTHPPLGKVFISLGIKLFGMTPFGWRIAGTLFGILMIPVMYILSKKIFKSAFISIVATVLLTFDFMHFSQTRIATIDVYVTFFIMLMYLFMYRYYAADFDNTSILKRFKYLLLSGISFGLAVACKWTAVYACLGLSVVFFIKIITEFKNRKKAFLGEFIKTGFFSVAAFILIPLLIYTLSYIPYLLANGDFSFSAILENQQSMFSYHAETVVNSTHPYSSKWYEWPIIYRPIWYYSGDLGGGIKEGISAFGNPIVWWTGILAFVMCIYYAFKKDRNAVFIVIGYLSCMLPWVFVERTTYIYHYFPCVPFVIIMICIVLDKLQGKTRIYTGAGICALAIILFILFYPVISGASVSEIYVIKVLKWFSSWVLI